MAKLPVRTASRDIVNKFLGYDHRKRIDDGAFYEMQNLSSDNYPMLSPRPGRATYPKFTGDVTGIIMKDRLCFVDGPNFFYGDVSFNMGLNSERKQLVSMGAYVLIFPDRKYINTADLSDRGDIDAAFTAEDQTRIHICRPNGQEYAEEYISDTEPDSPKDKSVWVNTSEYPNSISQWNEAAKCWTKVTTSCVKIHCMGISELFEVGDGVTVSGIKGNTGIVDFQTGEPLTEKQLEQLGDLEGAAVILDKGKTFGDEYIVIEGIMDADCIIPAAFTIKRQMPIVDFVVEHGNRLWGCRYGLDAGGEFVNIVYASKLGDFKNWTCYQGIDTDSYFANVGSDGPFTGAISYGRGDCVLFFKENGVHTVYGYGPSGFQVEYTACRGVQKGSAGSLAIVEGAVYYKSPTGVCAYSGGLPTEIGTAFGNISYHDACGGSYRHKYYLSMADPAGAYSLFAYDTRLGLWHREDNTQAVGWADAGAEAWMLLADGSRCCLNGTQKPQSTQEGAVKWSAQTGLLGIEHPDRKYISRINVRLRLDHGSSFALYIRYDSAGGWAKVWGIKSAAMRAYDIPVRIRRCDHLELRMEGQGPGEVYSLVKTYTTGSDKR